MVQHIRKRRRQRFWPDVQNGSRHVRGGGGPFPAGRPYHQRRPGDSAIQVHDGRVAEVVGLSEYLRTASQGSMAGSLYTLSMGQDLIENQPMHRRRLVDSLKSDS